MSTIVVFGGTGYTGRYIVSEAASRAHHVISVSRSAPLEPVEGVQYETTQAQDAAPLVIPGADVVVAALSPRGDMAGRLVEVYHELARSAAEAGARYVQIGGFSSLRPAPGETRFVEGDVPEQARAEVMEAEATRAMLVGTAPANLDWLFVSPAATYGAWMPGERTGSYRVGGDVALFDANGESNLSGADLAVALLDEIETPAHHREHIGIAY